MRKRKSLFKRIIRRFEIIILIAAIIYFLVSAERRIMAGITAISQIEARNLANNAIDSAVNEALAEMDTLSDDYYEIDEESGTLYANTMLINALCSAVSENISDETDELSKIKIAVHWGSVLGIDLFSNFGPTSTFSLRQMGESRVDYETSFISVGINQTNFKVWLYVVTEIQMVSPLRSQSVETNRKVMIIDTVIKGTVPDNYFDFN